METVFITGSSSGIGRETAKLFQAKGWNVIATMRSPQEEKELVTLKNTKVIPCDVTDLQSIQSAIKNGMDSFGNIDVLVNNAGYYTLGPLEAATSCQIKRQLDTNLLGLIEVTREMLPYFRKQKFGTIINISSIAGVISIPLQSLYHATKWGVEGFSESLQYELRPFNIRVKIVEPGVIRTNFLGRSMTMLQNPDLTAYEPYATRVINNIFQKGEKGSEPAEVAKTIYKAATDNKTRLRYATGKSKESVCIRRLLPTHVFLSFVRKEMEK